MVFYVAVERKPNSVSAAVARSGCDHFSAMCVATHLKQPTRGYKRLGAKALRLFGLAAGGVCHATDVTTRAVRSYRTISPLP